MKITLKTRGLFSRLLPEGSGTTAEIDVPDGSTPAGLIRHLGGEVDGRYLLVLNDKAVRPSETDIVTLNDGDNLSLMPPLKGG
ncbi:MAG: MoaD/ThiS family protein [Rhodospirillales bacterium]|jgi:molybdopterin converting factor small subunit|nr:MoaD/ThiS family protein [Rhodospirillales bacterium]MBT4041839.1 MoaD/ThiS family protein [Rhodospirillales bacterium]MBT4626823.1 MoaD/ThiS family protein [Rhodospirillales bacterium]MBT5351624.1 MoaD/ThiS family protein [Rhodospirillales bacterium]MBT5521194.1 MoaD/ThiS family protein [Rhodospirillales bacterium]